MFIGHSECLATVEIILLLDDLFARDELRDQLGPILTVSFGGRHLFFLLFSCPLLLRSVHALLEANSRLEVLSGKN